MLALDEHLDQRLDAEFDEIAGYLNAQHARLVDVTARLSAHPGSWQVPGVHTIEQYLCWRTGISAAHAHQIVADREPCRRVAGVRRHIPAAVSISVDQMTAIVAKSPRLGRATRR